MFYFFETLNQFEEWHNALCKTLGYPMPSTNQKTGLVDLNAPITYIYTEAIPYEDGFIAWAETKYAQGLEVSDYQPIRPE